jgi:hypothetical protein
LTSNLPFASVLTTPPASGTSPLASLPTDSGAELQPGVSVEAPTRKVVNAMDFIETYIEGSRGRALERSARAVGRCIVSGRRGLDSHEISRGGREARSFFRIDVRTG